MDFFSKKRFTVLAFSILIILNVFMLGMLWQTQLRKPPQPRPPDRRPGHIMEFLEEELKLTDEQAMKFEALRQEHFRHSNAVMADIHRLKKEILDEAFSDSPDTLRVKSLARQVGENQADFEEFLFHHFSDLKSICTPEQLEVLKKMFDEILERDRPRTPRKPHG